MDAMAKKEDAPAGNRSRHVLTLSLLFVSHFPRFFSPRLVL